MPKFAVFGVVAFALFGAFPDTTLLFCGKPGWHFFGPTARFFFFIKESINSFYTRFIFKKQPLGYAKKTAAGCDHVFASSIFWHFFAICSQKNLQILLLPQPAADFLALFFQLRVGIE